MPQRHVSVRLAAATFALLTVGALGACSGDDSPEAATSRSAGASPSPTARPSSPQATLDRKVPPAADAGGLCRKFDYAEVEQAIGVAFDVAAASGGGKSQACTLRRREAALPDLTLSFAPGSMEAEAFRGDVQPKGAANLDGSPGKAGYRMVRPAADGAGPSVEIGWVAGDGIYILVLTTEQGTGDDAANDYVAQLATLGKNL